MGSRCPASHRARYLRAPPTSRSPTALLPHKSELYGGFEAKHRVVVLLLKLAEPQEGHLSGPAAHISLEHLTKAALSGDPRSLSSFIQLSTPAFALKSHPFGEILPLFELHVLQPGIVLGLPFHPALVDRARPAILYHPLKLSLKWVGRAPRSSRATPPCRHTCTRTGPPWHCPIDLASYLLPGEELDHLANASVRAGKVSKGPVALDRRGSAHGSRTCSSSPSPGISARGSRSDTCRQASRFTSIYYIVVSLSCIALYDLLIVIFDIAS